jgi:formate hydrogenlyase subunit 3/multisubunit Na+/H+ antiporter MnhD subunit
VTAAPHASDAPQAAGASAAPPRGRGAVAPVVSGAATGAIGVAGVAGGVWAVFGAPGSVTIGWLIPLSGARWAFDPLAGVFLLVTGLVTVSVAPYVIGYARREHLRGITLATIPVFAAALLLVPAAGSAPTFLWAWELMAAASLLLVATEHTRPGVRSAALTYAVMTQLGFAAILLGLTVAAAAAGTPAFTGIAAAHLSGGVRDVVFAATVVGFGSKAGLVPLHGWLPLAHPAAPSPVSALMSAAMVNLGVYGLLRVDLQLLGADLTRWQAAVLLAVGAISAVYGVLQASVATDLKRLLAYSTTENMGLIVLALGAAALLRDGGARPAAAIAVAAALLHVFGHAAFKTLGFLCAGSVLAATGLRDLDLLGGLARRMPVTTVLFAIAALGASGLPLGSGFISEWLLVQALIHTRGSHDTGLALAMPIAVGAVALTTGLGVAAMVKAFGIGFLARPRSAQAGAAARTPPSMVIGMIAAAAGCVVIGIAPIAVFGLLRRVLAELPIARTVDMRPLAATMRLPGAAGSINPTVLAAAFAAASALVVAAVWWGRRRRPAAATAPLWACGGDQPTARMQYTATSFAEPLQRVFDDVLRPDTDIEITHQRESEYLVDQVRFRNQLADTVADRLARPVLAAVWWCARWMRAAHPGNVHRYLAYGAIGVLLVLVIAR